MFNTKYWRTKSDPHLTENKYNSRKCHSMSVTCEIWIIKVCSKCQDVIKLGHIDQVMGIPTISVYCVHVVSNGFISFPLCLNNTPQSG